MAKEKQSPKVKNANPNKRRGAQPGDKKVIRSKGRARGVKVIAVGGDLFSDIRHDKMSRRLETSSARQLTPSVSFKQRFTEAFAQRVTVDANEYQWSSQTRRLAGAYIKSLTSGNGSIPDGLRGKPVERIQWHFAMTCAKLNADPDRFPGQSQDWFADKQAQAYKIIAQRRSQNAARMTTMAPA
jgi:hypothetical protein